MDRTMLAQTDFKENTSVSVVEIFAGTGGLGLGFKRAGFKLLRAYDLSEDACRNYQRLLPGHPIEQTDLAQFDPHLLPDADMIIGGPPCQAFSEGNAERPGEGSELNLWPTTINIVRAKRPARFLFENVRGLIKDHQAYFQEILASFRALGYTVSWRLLNAADYGVPQTRHRVFIAGWLPGLTPWQWPTPTHHDGPYQATLWGGTKQPWVSWDAALGDWLTKNHEPTELPEWVLKKVGKELGSAYFRAVDISGNKKVWRLSGQPAFTVLTDYGHPTRVKVPLASTYPDGLYNCRDYNKSRHWRDLGQPAFTVTGNDSHGRERVKLSTTATDQGETVVYKLDKEARCILQTLPPVVDSNVCIGNAVPPMLAQAVAGANLLVAEKAVQ